MALVGVWARESRGIGVRRMRRWGVVVLREYFPFLGLWGLFEGEGEGGGGKGDGETGKRQEGKGEYREETC